MDWSKAWQQSWDKAGLAPNPQLLAQLLQAYQEPQRAYHTLQHLAEGLVLLQQTLHLANHPTAVGLAWWFHDSVYNPQAPDNEERSAQWAYEALRETGAADLAQQVQSLVLLTRHTQLPQEPNEQLLIDTDLAILGANPQRFAEYEQQVVQEYSFVPPNEFGPRRAKVLQSFLQRQPLYQTTWFQERFEQNARHNLSTAIVRWQGR